MSDPPVLEFDQGRAGLYFPRPERKHAVLVPVVDDVSTTITAEWGAAQHFIGPYYLIIDPETGKGAYGSAKIQWENMHQQVPSQYPATAWVKVTPVEAYQVDAPCVIPTFIKEAEVTLDGGDFAVRQPGGEVQHILVAKMPRLYYTPEEAAELGLTVDNFRDFAVSQVMQAVS